SFKNRQITALVVDTKGIFGAFDGRIEVRGVDAKRARGAAECLQSAENKIDERLFLGIARHLDQVEGRALIESQNRVIDQRNGGSALIPDVHAVALTKRVSQLRLLPVGRIAA